MDNSQRLNIWKSPRAALLMLGALLAAAALVVAFSPSEQTLGAAVKVVYVHVALSRAGAVLLGAAGLLGLAVLVTANEPLARWMRALAWAGLTLYALGFAVSILAQVTSWGGVIWQEPRVRIATNMLAAAAIVEALVWWLKHPRWEGLVRAMYAAGLWSANLRADNVLHPGNAISGSTSAAIQWTGILLLALALLIGVWLAWQIWQRLAG